MFVNTKMDDGPCDLVHSEELKEKFERDNDPFKYDALIERDFLTRIGDIDRSIKVVHIHRALLQCTFKFPFTSSFFLFDRSLCHATFI